MENRLKKIASETNQPKPDIVIGADTMVTLNGELYGKPKNKQDAVETLKKWVNFFYTDISSDYFVI